MTDRLHRALLTAAGDRPSRSARAGVASQRAPHCSLRQAASCAPSLCRSRHNGNKLIALCHTAGGIGIMCQVSVLVGVKLIGNIARHQDGCIAGEARRESCVRYRTPDRRADPETAALCSSLARRSDQGGRSGAGSLGARAVTQPSLAARDRHPGLDVHHSAQHSRQQSAATPAPRRLSGVER